VAKSIGAKMIAQRFRRNPKLAAGFVLAIALAMAFAASFAFKVATRLGRDFEPLQGWMTVGYIARSRDLDPRRIDTIAGLPFPADGRPLTLQEIANERGVPVEDVIAQVRDALRQIRRGGDGGADAEPSGTDKQPATDP
jgi:hypothetical protein